MQGLINASLKVHAIEQDQKQSTAMMAVEEQEEGEEAKLEVKIVEVKFSKCEKPTQSPPAQQCQTCGV